MTGVTVTELHTQDGWDWPNGCGDERWPSGGQHQPPAPVAVKAPESAAQERRCILADCRCARYSRSGSPARGCEYYHPTYYHPIFPVDYEVEPS